MMRIVKRRFFTGYKLVFEKYETKMLEIYIEHLHNSSVQGIENLLAHLFQKQVDYVMMVLSGEMIDIMKPDDFLDNFVNEN